MTELMNYPDLLATVGKMQQQIYRLNKKVEALKIAKFRSQGPVKAYPEYADLDSQIVLLRYLAKHTDYPSHIATKLGLRRSKVSTILCMFAKEGLVSFYVAGDSHMYKLTDLGQRVVSLLNSDMEGA